jgi:hypothetical protein
MKGTNMLQKFKYHLLITATVLMGLAPVAMPLAASAADSVCGSNTIGSAISSGANGAATGTAGGDCTDGTGVNDSSLSTIGHKIVNIFSLLIGIVAVIMIIVGGFRYITSGGDSGRVGGAKNTLIYAIIGLVIVALAQIIVHFVLNQTNGAISGS